ncbi:YebC/PmpR family DNA-binding transcriptional regulator, partial [Patescibacteria group bacterium]
EEDDEMVVHTKVENLQKVKEAIDKEEIPVESADLEYVPKEEKELSEEDESKVEKLMEALDDNEDVSDIFTNVK